MPNLASWSRPRSHSPIRGAPTTSTAAEAALQQLIADTRESAATGRAEAATALAHITDLQFRPLLVPLLYDRDLVVVQKAIRSARTMGASDGLFVPGLLSLLGHRALKADARDALVGYGEEAVGVLAYSLRDQREHVWIRRHIPATLAQLGTQRSMDALVAALDDPDGFLRYKAIAAIEKIRRDHPAIACPRPVIESQVVKETSRYYSGLTLQQNLLRHTPDAYDSLLARALQDKLHRTIDRIYRLLGLLYHGDDVAAARYTIEQGESRRRAAAVEYLDNLLGGVVRKRVMPILDDSPLTDKVRYANLVLKSRPRDLEDTLAQLVHEDDPVVAAAAIHFVGQREIWGLTDDLGVRGHAQIQRGSRGRRGRLMGVGGQASSAFGRRDDRVAADRRARRSRPGDSAVCVVVSRRALPDRAGGRRDPTPRRPRSVSRGRARRRRAVPARGRCGNDRRRQRRARRLSRPRSSASRTCSRALRFAARCARSKPPSASASPRTTS